MNNLVKLGFWCCPIIAALLVVVWFMRPASAVQIGGDEGMEFAKAQIFSKEPDKAKDMWSDQPYLYTAVAGRLFRAFGPSALIPRLMTLACFAGMLAAMFRLMPDGSKGLERWLCSLLLLAWPSMGELAASAMCELPAIGLGMISIACLKSANGPLGVAWVAFSALLFGAALHIKFTAALILPAGFLFFWMRARKRWMVAAWAIMIGAVFGVGVAFSPAWRIEELWSSHVKAVQMADEAASLHYDPWELVASAGTVLAAIYAILLVARRKAWSEIVFPAAFLLTAAGVHLVHRPWWYFYNVHLAAPLVLLAGYGFGSALRGVPTGDGGRAGDASPSVADGGSVIWAASIISLLIGLDSRGLFALRTEVPGGNLITSDHLLSSILAYKAKTRYFFATELGEVYSVHADLVVPPELVFVSRKRFWSGNITDVGVLELVRKYMPEQVVMPRSTVIGPKWKEFFSHNYTMVDCQDRGFLYVANSLNPIPMPSPAKQRQLLGL